MDSAKGYFLPGLQLPLQFCYQFRCLVNRGTMGANSLPKSVTRQRRGSDSNPGLSAPESSTLTTRLPIEPRHYANKLGRIVLLSARPAVTRAIPNAEYRGEQ